MIECKAKETCFYGGKRKRKGETVMFQGAAKDIPKYLEKVEAKKLAAKKEEDK